MVLFLFTGALSIIGTGLAAFALIRTAKNKQTIDEVVKQLEENIFKNSDNINNIREKVRVLDGYIDSVLVDLGALNKHIVDIEHRIDGTVAESIKPDRKPTAKKRVKVKED